MIETLAYVQNIARRNPNLGNRMLEDFQSRLIATCFLRRNYIREFDSKQSASFLKEVIVGV